MATMKGVEAAPAVSLRTVLLQRSRSKRTLLGAPGLTTRSKKLLGTSASLLGTSALLVVSRS